MKRTLVLPIFLVLALWSPASADAQDTARDAPFTETLAPGTTYDSSIPTLVEVAGHDFDEEVTPPHEVAAYMRALAEAAPERTHLIEYATSHEGRPLQMLVIGSADRIARLGEVREGLQALANPDRHDDAELQRLTDELPVVTALLHGVHGNEISSSGAAMAEAYHLLAATNDPVVETILSESLVVIDPNQNPDGRYRFVSRYAQNRAFPPDPDPVSAAHDEPWPGGRVNHYLFDLNRDWFLQSQPESRGKVAALLSFQPHVTVDLHEMGGDSYYYFPPAAVPGNTYVTETQNEWYMRFGRNNAERFDQRGFQYFTREIFDAFYPGYGASWPTTHGSLGMTFEQASAGGLVYRRDDGTLLTYGDGVLHHFTSALRTARTAAENRQALLEDFVDFRRSAIEMGRTGETRTYVLHSSHDPEMAEELARLLVRNGIRVQEADEPVRVQGRTLPAGETWLVPMDQPAHRLARNLLDPHTPMNPDFVQEQIERRARRLPDQIYDVTAWSLPLLWDVEAIPVGESVEVASTAVEADPAMDSSPRLPDARVGYLLPWSSATASATAEALQEGLTLRVGTGSFVMDGRDFPVGTVIVRSDENPDDLPATLGRIVQEHGAEAVPVDSSMVDEGMSLGSSRVRRLVAPSVAIVWDEPAATYSAGWVRYTLEDRYGLRVTAIRADRLPRTVLSDYDVIVVPNGRYGGAWSDAFVEELADWMSDGGTLVTMAESSVWAAREGILGTTPEVRGGAPAVGEGRPGEVKDVQEQPIDYLEAIAPAVEDPEQTPGAIVNVILDETHWLSSGTDGRIGALVESDRIFTPLTLDVGTNVGRYAGMEELVAGGIVWEEARPQLANKAFLMYQPRGRGQLVAFAEDPNYRAYARATQLLFVNAVLIGPAR